MVSRSGKRLLIGQGKRDIHKDLNKPTAELCLAEICTARHLFGTSGFEFGHWAKSKPPLSKSAIGHSSDLHDLMNWMEQEPTAEHRSSPRKTKAHEAVGSQQGCREIDDTQPKWFDKVRLSEVHPPQSSNILKTYSLLVGSRVEPDL